MTAVRQAVVLARREVGLELAGRESLVVVLPFVAALMVLAGIGFGPDPAVLAATAPGLVWLVVLVAALPLTTGVAAAERHEDAWDLLVGLIRPTALLAGKLVVLWSWLLACWALASLLAGVLLAVSWTPWVLAAGALGTLGVAVTCVVLGVLLPHGARRPGLLPVLLLPGTLPVLLAGTLVATADSPTPWLALLAAFDAVSLVAAWAVFPSLLEE